MFTFLQMVLAFLIVIGILVIVHEVGHYWVARRLGVKILRFSVGFGHPLWSRRYGPDATEFVLAALPVGGYVKMLDEREGEVAANELTRAFNRQSLQVRTAIVSAGPLANLVFAVMMFTWMYLLGITGMKPLIGEITPQSLAAQAGFQRGYEIIAVGNIPTVRWESVVQATLEQLLDQQSEVTYSVLDERGSSRSLVLSLTGLTLDDITEGRFFKKVGLYPLRPPPPPAVIQGVMPNSAAQRDGLQVGDRILSLDNVAIQNWENWANYIAKHPNQSIKAVVERNQANIVLFLKPNDENGQGKMGVYGTQVSIPANYLRVEQYSLGKAFWEGLTVTWETSILMLRVIVKMMTLEISLQNLGGPLSIAEYAGKSAQSGLVTFLFFLGSVSVSLGIINLLPIPLLDGGHLLLYGIEFMKGNPLQESTENFLQHIGLAILLSLMGLAIVNDLGRLLGN